jgi:CubicO group peptidase (beta-lactamase class C family)
MKPVNMFQKLIKVASPHQVTCISPDEEDPLSAGVPPENIDAIWNSVVSLYKTGLHPAIALCIRRNGKIIMDRTIGHAQGNGPHQKKLREKQPATLDTYFNLFSASKSVTAMLIHLLDERRMLHLDDPVVRYIPEFGQHNKQHITIRHLLTHRAGIPNIKAKGKMLEILTDRDEILKQLCESKVSSRPGRNLAYHAITGGFALGEIIERVTGQTPREFLQTEICEPLGLNQFNYGVPPEQTPNVAAHAYTGPPPKRPFKWFLERSLGLDIRSAVDLSNDFRFLTEIVPSANVISTARETTLFFELLLRKGELNGVQIFQPATIERAVAEQSYMELDSTLLMPVRYSMGFMLGARFGSFYGLDTKEAFGHLGFTNVLAYADPERDISVALFNTGKPFITAKLLRWLNVTRVIAQKIPKQVPAPPR